MGKREAAAVYRRRRLVVVAVVVVPLLLLVRFVFFRSEPAPEPASVPTADVTQTATPSETPSPTKSATPTPTITDCVNSNIKVSVTADAQTYVIGQPITIAMRIQNVGDAACNRDVGALVNEVCVTNPDGLVVWTSDACQKDAKPQVALMKADAVFGNTQVWSGLNSGQNCTNAAADSQPGKYLIYARNDVVVSKPFAIELTQ